MTEMTEMPIMPALYSLYSKLQRILNTNIAVFYPLLMSHTFAESYLNQIATVGKDTQPNK